MPNSLQSSDIGSPASLRATNCILSSMTEHSFQGISPSLLQEEVLPMCSVQCVTYVSGRSIFAMLKDQIERLCVCGLSSCRIHSTVRKRRSEQRRFFSSGCLIYRICTLFASSRVLIASTFFSVSAAPNPAQRAKLLLLVRPIGRFAALAESVKSHFPRFDDNFLVDSTP